MYIFMSDSPHSSRDVRSWVKDSVRGVIDQLGPDGPGEEAGGDASPPSAASAEPLPQRPDLDGDPEIALCRLLRSHDGILRQSTVVEMTGWSKSKVSRKLSSLEDAGHVHRVRQGREKVVYLEDPPASSLGTSGDARPSS
jgi:DNA-binding transcriptional ArsR family regulator